MEYTTLPRGERTPVPGNSSKLGFGMMRLPQHSPEATDIDYAQVSQMVDRFLAAGFTYFDTSWAYHNGASETAVNKCLVSRHPRDSFVLASKLPIFAITDERQAEEIFSQQLERCGVSYFDYYLLHNVNWMRYRQIIRDAHLFEHMKQWKEQGKIRHIAFSFHDTADVLDQILTDHPEVEAVQIALNYFDWDARYIQARQCYETIRAHGRQVIIMEPVKGGMLAKVPEAAEMLMRAARPEYSTVSWALRFAAGLDGVLAVLSGMSTPEQMEDNAATFQKFQPMNESELEILRQTVVLYRQSGPVGTADFTPYEAVNPNGVSAADILDTYNACMLQPVPTFGAEGNYFSCQKAKHGLHKEDRCIPGPAVLADGTDVTELVHKAEDFLNKSTFFQYEF